MTATSSYKLVTHAIRYPAGVVVIWNQCVRCGAMEFLPTWDEVADG